MLRPSQAVLRGAAPLVFAAVALASARAADPWVRLPLFESADLKSWSPAESTVAASTERTHTATAALHWHVGVDHTTGEPKYPIGWPRISRTLPDGVQRDWSGWDYLQCWIFVASNRSTLPSIPAGLGLHTPDRAGAYQRTLSELKIGEWVQIKIPLSTIPRHHDVRQIQFHIAEQNYRHGDTLDFYLSDLALLRHAAPTLLDFTPESAVLFTDAVRIPLRLTLAGVPAGQPTEVVCELLREGRVVAHTSVAALRGVQSAALTWASPTLPAGEYELRATLGGQSQPATARIRLVDSPWQ